MEILAPLLKKTSSAVIGFLLTGVMFREYANHMSDIPSFIPEKYFYISLGVTAFACFAYLLSPNKQ